MQSYLPKKFEGNPLTIASEKRLFFPGLTREFTHSKSSPGTRSLIFISLIFPGSGLGVLHTVSPCFGANSLQIS